MPDFDSTKRPGAQTIRIATAKGGKTDVALTPQDITWGDFCDNLSRPKVGPKDGPYYIRGGDLTEPRRADENLLDADLLIIDGDSRFDPETGEIISGAPPLDETKAALDDIGLTYFAHTTHSFAPDAGIWKYRIILPAHMRNQAELEAAVDWLMAQLHARGVYLVDVNEQHKWAQPWYGPRVASEAAAAAFQHHRHDGKAFDVATAVAWHKRQQEAAATVERARTSEPRRDTGQPSVIADYNDGASLADVRAMLERRGYKFAGRKGETYRYICPTSESGTAGVVIFKGKRGHWCTYSHHGKHDPLSGKVCDPFELLAMFEFGGDHKKAVRGISPAKGAAAGSASGFDGFDAGQGGDNGDTGSKPKPHSMLEFIQFTPSLVPPRYTVPGFIGDGLCVIAGQHGIGKTTALLPLVAIVAGLHTLVDALAPRHWRYAVYITEDVEQVQRILYAIAGGDSYAIAKIQERIKIVSARRLDVADFVKVGNAYKDSLSRVVDNVTLPPLIVIDTKSAVFSINDENDNAEASKIMAALKQDFCGLPTWIIGHIAKANITRCATPESCCRFTPALTLRKISGVQYSLEHYFSMT